MNKNICDIIGNTPIIELCNVRKKYNLFGRLFAKLEFMNPSHSKKDRIAKYIILSAIESGKLKPGQMVVEATSGNTGIALSMVCASLGYSFTAFISAGNSKERIVMMKSFGAKVIIVDQKVSKYGKVTGCDFDEVKNAAKQFSEENGAFFVNQFENPENIKGQEIVGEEIINDFSKNNINLELFCDYIGTGGCFTGVSSVLKKFNDNLKSYAVEPINSAVLSGEIDVAGHHIIQGGGYGYKTLTNLKKELIDGYVTITDKQAIEGMKILSELEGIFGSFSSGANLMAMIKIMQMSENDGKNGIFLVCDSGLKYISVLDDGLI